MSSAIEVKYWLKLLAISFGLVIVLSFSIIHVVDKVFWFYIENFFYAFPNFILLKIVGGVAIDTEKWITISYFIRFDKTIAIA